MIAELINFYKDTPLKNSLSSEENKKAEDLTIKENEKMSLAEKIRQQRLLEEKEKQKQKYIKELHKSKKVDLEKFLTRNKIKEQKRLYNIEKERNELKEKEKSLLQETPKISKNSIIISLTDKKMPLYLRTQYIIESKNKKLEELRNSYKLNLSTSPKKEITEEKRLKTLSYSVERFYENQIQWSSKIKKENVFRKNFLEINNKDLIECKFHPELSECSLEIIRTINYKNNINEKKNNESIYEKLYKEKDEKEKKRKLIIEKNLPSFKPYINQNPKYKKIAAKFINKGTYSYNIKMQENKENIMKKKLEDEKNKKKKKKNKSVDRRKKNNNIDIMEIGKIKKSESVDHWSTSLMKMKPKKDKILTDNLYHLNIMPSAAWNENGVNPVPLKGESKNIIKAFL
jgi:hypothetical protein